MKRSYINLITVILIIVEIVLSLVSLNEIYLFVNQTLQTKYIAVCLLCIGISTVFTFFYWICFPSLSNPAQVRFHIEEVYGLKRFNFSYTYHFLVFAVVCFFINAWELLIPSIFLFCIWNYIRVYQNEMADKHDLEMAKEKAKEKPIVILNN